ncbi:unnamed protein product [Peronospora effusa]|nr:unnamed protein product [Peronospora effusa]
MRMVDPLAHDPHGFRECGAALRQCWLFHGWSFMDMRNPSALPCTRSLEQVKHFYSRCDLLDDTTRRFLYTLTANSLGSRLETIQAVAWRTDETNLPPGCTAQVIADQQQRDSNRPVNGLAADEGRARFLADREPKKAAPLCELTLKLAFHLTATLVSVTSCTYQAI